MHNKTNLKNAAIGILALFCVAPSVLANNSGPINKALWRQSADYPIPYGIPDEKEITNTLERVHGFLDQNCGIKLTDTDGNPINSISDSDLPLLKEGPLRILSYELGVVYDGMLQSYQQTGNPAFLDFCQDRLQLLADLGRHYDKIPSTQRPKNYPTKWLQEPEKLDHCGSMTAALINAVQSGAIDDAHQLIEPSMYHVSNTQYRLSSGALARNSPLPNTIWLDDMYMGIPALARMGQKTGDSSYFDDATLQVIEISKRLFLPEKKLYRHSWIQEMEPQRNFHWGRANGWAILATTELLSVLPEDHKNYQQVLSIYRAHAQGIVNYQQNDGLWPQLLDRPDTYHETSASAIFVYSLARGINRGWLQPTSFGGNVALGWNAISEKVDLSGQLHDVCIATGIGWDPAYYAYRPTSPYAEHGYGPLLLAGSELLSLLKNPNVTYEHRNHAVRLLSQP